MVTQAKRSKMTVCQQSFQIAADSKLHVLNCLFIAYGDLVDLTTKSAHNDV